MGPTHLPSRANPAVVPLWLAGVAWIALCVAQPLRALQEPAAAEPPAPGEPASVLVTAGAGAGGVRVTLTFSHAVEYRLEESRSRLKVLLSEPLAENSWMERDMDGDVVRRIRVEPSGRTPQIIFNLGRGFDHFSSAELGDPFRLVLDFRREGAPASPEADGEWSPDADAGIGEPGALEEGGAGTAFPGESAPAGMAPGFPLVVLDPGHGGEEDGAVGQDGLKEKDLALDVALRLRARLAGAGFGVALTREDDRALDLTSRTALANSLKGAAFISIHANASGRASARGAETYFLATGGGDDESASLARREGVLERSAGRGPAGDLPPVELVLWEMAQAEHLSRSSRLAEVIQEELNALDGVRDRGVKQAPFRVLVGAAMPAVLVEVGFLSNPEEVQRLGTEGYRERIAELLAAALQRFMRETGLAAGARLAPPGQFEPR